MDCPVCGFPVANARGLASHFRHQSDTHPDYETWKADQKWAGKTEDVDFVRCRECGYRSASLARHLGSAHGFTADQYRAKHGSGALIRNRRTEAKRRAGIKNAKQDRTGTKQVPCTTCGVAITVHKHAGSLHDLRCSTCKAASEEARWEGLEDGFDYVTCLDCGYRAVNLTSHMQNAHPDYRERHPDAQIVAESSSHRSRSGNWKWDGVITEQSLTPYKDDKGRVEVARAADGFGCCHWTVLRYCRALGIPTRNKLATQKRVLDTVAQVLGEPYKWEWSHPEIKNPETGYTLFFDGYFPKARVICEYHGRQHFEMIPYWHKTEEDFQRRVALEAYKVQRARDLGYRVIEVRFDDPLTSVDFYRGLLRR